MNITTPKHCIAAAIATVALGCAPSAFAELSGNIGVTSNYVWRGATQTDDSAAVSGGLDYATEAGFYIGTWASNVDFGGGGEVEWDIYGGYGGTIGEDFGYDLGLIAYLYPNSDDANFFEVAGSISYSVLSAGIHYTFASDVAETVAAPDVFIEGDIYTYISAGFDLEDDWSVGFTVGYYMFDDDGVANTDLDYIHGQIDISKDAGDFGTFTFSASIADEEANGGDDDPKIFVSWGKGF